MRSSRGWSRPGSTRKDIVVFDRYKDQFLQAGYEKNLPDGCRWDWAVDTYDEAQLDIAQYDPDVFATLDIVHARPGVHDPKDERTRRSHLAKVVTQRVNKLICIPVLKDHGSGGVTLALKNMSHGLVNNVCRSHGTPRHEHLQPVHPRDRRRTRSSARRRSSRCSTASTPSSRGARGVEEVRLAVRGPLLRHRPRGHGPDRLGDRRRQAGGAGLPPVAEAGQAGKNPTGTEAFDFRQPQHIAGAGALGLGVYDRAKIDHRVVKLG